MNDATFAQRRDRLRHEDVDCVLITNPINVTYLTGFSGDSTYLILTKAKTLLVSDGRYSEQLKDECPGLDAFIRGPAHPLPDATILAPVSLVTCSMLKSTMPPSRAAMTP